MIVLDTNVISELWKVAPDPNVQAWVDAQMVETLYLTAITVAELRFGLAAMPKGKRRAIYQERLEQDVLPAFMGRVLSFDLDASKAYVELMARARVAGKALAPQTATLRLPQPRMVCKSPHAIPAPSRRRA